MSRNYYRHLIGGAAPPIQNNTVTNYRFDESSGNLIDYSGNGNHGIVNGATYNHAGKINKSYSFDGINDTVNLGDSSSLQFGTGNFTVVFWVYMNDLKTNDTASQNTFVSKDFTAYEITLYLGKLRCFIGGSPTENRLIGVTNFNIDQWYLVLLERTDTEVRLELNNVLEDSKPRINVDVSNSGINTLLGSRPNTENFKLLLSGRLDSLEMYNYSLTQAEKDAIWNGGLGREL